MKPELRKEITEFMRDLEESYHYGKKKTPQNLDKDSLEIIWQLLADPEDKIYQNSITLGSQQAFLKRWGTGFKMHDKICK